MTDEPKETLLTFPCDFTIKVFGTASPAFDAAVSDIIHKHIDQEGFTDIIFPASFFYPIDKKTKGNAIHKMIRPETMAIHHWAGSWIYKKEAFVPGIEIRCVQEGDELQFKIINQQQVPPSDHS